jgi:hypothetical protein
MADHIRYDLLTQQALLGVVRQVLSDAAKKGLPGDHHFYISFDTHAEGVRLSERLRTQYPEEMTIILQHQFWDLTVSEAGFEVGMSFGGVPEKLFVPFAAIRGFFDPSVQLGMQFEEIVEGDDKPAMEPAKKPRLPVSTAPATPVPAVAPASAKLDNKFETRLEAKFETKLDAKIGEKPAVNPAAEPPEPDKPSGGGEVVRLDRFRKK